eukprot:1159517-Amphidinium_carterae.1
MAAILRAQGLGMGLSPCSSKRLTAPLCALPIHMFDSEFELATPVRIARKLVHQCVSSGRAAVSAQGGCLVLLVTSLKTTLKMEMCRIGNSLFQLCTNIENSDIFKVAEPAEEPRYWHPSNAAEAKVLARKCAVAVEL